MDAGSSPAWRRAQRRITTTIPAKAGIQWTPGQARHGGGHSAVSQPPFLRKQESNGYRVKPGMAAGTAPYHNHHSCESRNPMDAGSSPVWRVHSAVSQPPFLRKQESNGRRVKPGMAAGTAPYHNHHSCESRNPMDAGSSPAWRRAQRRITTTIPAKAGIQWTPGQARYGGGHSAVSQPPFLRKQESNGRRVKPGMAAGTAPYHNHHSCESRNPHGGGRRITTTIPAKAGIQWIPGQARHGGGHSLIWDTHKLETLDFYDTIYRCPELNDETIHCHD